MFQCVLSTVKAIIGTNQPAALSWAADINLFKQCQRVHKAQRRSQFAWCVMLTHRFP